MTNSDNELYTCRRCLDAMNFQTWPYCERCAMDVSFINTDSNYKTKITKAMARVHVARREGAYRVWQ